MGPTLYGMIIRYVSWKTLLFPWACFSWPNAGFSTHEFPSKLPRECMKYQLDMLSPMDVYYRRCIYINEYDNMLCVF